MLHRGSTTNTSGYVIDTLRERGEIPNGGIYKGKGGALCTPGYLDTPWYPTLYRSSARRACDSSETRHDGARRGLPATHAVFVLSKDSSVCLYECHPTRNDRMVQEKITDGTRIAQFLASEFTGLNRGALEGIEVTDADDSAEPSPDGTLAYRITRADQPVATVLLYPEAVELRRVGGEWVTPDDGDDVAIEGDVLRVGHAAAVKQALDAIRATLD